LSAYSRSTLPTMTLRKTKIEKVTRRSEKSLRPTLVRASARWYHMPGSVTVGSACTNYTHRRSLACGLAHRRRNSWQTSVLKSSY
jgi:hypothetical protein